MKKGLCLAFFLMMASVQSSAYLKEVAQCGTIEFAESNYAARDTNDRVYTMALDCNQDRKIDAADGNRAINIPVGQLTEATLKWLKNTKRMVVNKSKSAKQNPYICVEVEAASDPCGSGKNALGFKPKFSLAK